MLNTPEFHRGRAGEQLSAEWLKARGWYVVPSYDYSGKDDDKPPKLQGSSTGYAIPDLDVSRDGKRIWVEVKLKRGPTYHRRSDTWEHGISNRLAGHYRSVQKITGCPVWLFIIEEDAGLLIAAALDSLGQGRVFSEYRKGYGGIVYWPRDRFKEIARLRREDAINKSANLPTSPRNAT